MEIKDLSVEIASTEEVRGGQSSIVEQFSGQFGGNTIANSVNTLGLGNNVGVISNISNDQLSGQAAGVSQEANLAHVTDIMNSLFVKL